MQQAAADPYRAPVAHVQDPASTVVSEINIWSAKGRLGRVRYIGYSMGFGLLINVIMTGATYAAGPGAWFPISIVGTIASLWIYTLLSIQRAHDFNTTGWLSLLAYVPLLNFLFWFIPGTDGENEYGHKTPPNSTLAVLLACLIPFVFIAGIIAAIAIPAYSDYIQRAEMSQSK